MTLLARAAAKLKIWNTQYPVLSPALADAAHGLEEWNTKWIAINPMDRQAILVGTGVLGGAIVAATIAGGISANIPLPTQPALQSAAPTPAKTPDFFTLEDNQLQGIRAAKAAAARVRVNEGLENTPVRTMGDYIAQDGSFDVTFFGMGKTGLATNNLITFKFSPKKMGKPDLNVRDATSFKIGTKLDRGILRSQVGPDQYGVLTSRTRQIEDKAKAAGVPEVKEQGTPALGFTP